MKENYKNKKEQSRASRRDDGFTLVEMLVVVLILALIIVFTFTAFDISRNKTRDAVLISELEQLRGIAETVYHPEVGYKELYNMRGNPVSISDDYPTIKQIRQRAIDVGSTINIWFPEDVGGEVGYHEYCAYATPLFYSGKDSYCIDSSGREVFADFAEINCTDLASPANCEYRE
jgi:prepilin-type N-terminal cleavage/methylation domain-containing protein